MARTPAAKRGQTARARARQALEFELGQRALSDLLMESAYPADQVLRRLEAAIGPHLILGVPADLGPDLDEAVFLALRRALGIVKPKRRQRSRALNPKPKPRRP